MIFIKKCIYVCCICLFVATGLTTDIYAGKISESLVENSIDELSVVTEIKQIEPVTIRQTINSEFDILKPSGYSKEELLSAVSDEYRYRMIPYVDALIEAEKIYGVNALYLLCTIGLESGWGQYESGINNLAGWRNYDGSYRNFASIYDCIMHIANNLSTKYKDSVGSKLIDICGRYSESDSYYETLSSIMIGRERVINELNKKGEYI